MDVTIGGRLFEYTHLPFGYYNSLHEFLQTLWATMLHIQRQVSSRVMYYMDNILLLSPSLLVHEKDLEASF